MAKGKTAHSASIGDRWKAFRSRLTFWRGVRYAFYGLFALTLMGGAYGFYTWQTLYQGMPELPATEELWTKDRDPAIEFVDKDGTTIAIRGNRYGRRVSVTALPPHVVQPFLAAEDKRFYEHDGADNTALIRAVWLNWRAGETVSGGSTITQQLIKNLVLSPKQTIKRKAQEVKLARQLETRLSKNEILDLYLNRMYFGSGLYGITAASTHYFGKAPEELTVGEAALLAAVLQAPSRMALRDNPEDAIKRRAYVLDEMVDGGFITIEEATLANAEPLTLIDRAPNDPVLGYILDEATSRATAMLPQVPPDLVITLSIDPELQTAVDAAIKAKMAKDGAAVDASQVGAVIMDKSGAVLAMVGGVDYAASAFNRVTQAKRQPGSSFKPIVYAAALETGLTPYDVREDAPLKIGKWEPENYGGGYLGPMTLGEALTRSTNTIAAQITQETTEQRVVDTAKRFGITADLKPYPAIALGSQETTLWEMTRAFGTFQSGGNRLDPYLILRLEDTRGNVLYNRPTYTPSRVYDAALAKQMNAMMARVVNTPMGTGTRAKIDGWTVAGKTGTSQEWRDALFIGFTADLVGGVWVGNDDDTPMKRVTGGGLPADIWSDIMEIAHKGRKPKPLIGATGVYTITPEAEKRIAFYRGLGQAFDTVTGRQVAASAGETRQQAQ